MNKTTQQYIMDSTIFIIFALEKYFKTKSILKQ